LSKEAIAKEPLNILVNPDLIRKQKPWRIDIAYLLNLFLNFISKLESLDLRLCGSAALSSALIYRLKVEALFLSERMSEEKRPVDVGDIPFILSMPIRYELHTTSVEDLIAALQRLVEEITARTEPERPKPVSREPVVEIDQFINRLKESLEPFKASLLEMLKSGPILFSTLVKGKSVVEAARVFIFLLFLASDGVVFLEQIEEDLLITGAAGFV
jgi:segregation and condensation protein A